MRRTLTKAEMKIFEEYCLKVVGRLPSEQALHVVDALLNDEQIRGGTPMLTEEETVALLGIPK